MNGLLQWRLAARLLVRDWRAGELRILVAAVVIAVAASTAIAFFTDRIGRALLSESAEFLGADMALTSSRPVDEAWLAHAGTLGVRAVETLEFASVVVSGERLQLASVKAADERFPLRGGMRTAEALFAPDAPTQGGPRPGEAWAEARLLTRLDIGVGDRVEVGEHSLQITRVLTFEPGRMGNFFGVSPRLLMHRDDLPRTGIVQPGSRVSYQYLFAGGEAPLARYRGWLKQRLGPSHELIGVHEGRRALGTALDRAERYLGLSVLVAVILAGVAIAMAARHYSERHFDMSAMLRCLGASQGAVLALYIPQLLLLGLLASGVGCALGWVFQYGLFHLLGDVLPRPPGDASLRPVLAGFVTGMVALAGFALPPVLRLRGVPPLRVLRRDLTPLPTSAWLVYGMAIAAVVALMWRYTGNWSLTVTVLAGGAAAAAVLALLAALLLGAGRSLHRQVGVAWRFGLNNLWRRARLSVGQILAFGLTLMAMAVIALVRTDLLEAWRTQLPVDAPNHFAVNILPEKVDAFGEFLHMRGISASELYPMIRGRLVTINGEGVRQAVTKEARANNALNRELNLTWTTMLQEDNRIREGRWWGADDAGQARVSVEARLAERLGIGLGDRLGFSIGGEQLEAEVTSIRSVEWDSFRPNFYMVFPPGVLDGYAATYLTSFRLSGTGKQALMELVRAFPAVTVLELDLIMNQVQRMFRQVTLAVEYVLMFVLLAGFAVLFAALQSSLDDRLYEGALLRTLGASRRQLRAGHLAEFAALGVLAGLVAAIGTESLAYLLYTRIMNLDYSLKWQVWVAAPLAGALLIGLAGYWGTRPVARHSPLAVFRRL